MDDELRATIDVTIEVTYPDGRRVSISEWVPEKPDVDQREEIADTIRGVSVGAAVRIGGDDYDDTMRWSPVQGSEAPHP